MLVKRLRLFRTRNLMFGDTLALSYREHDAIVRAVEARDAAAAFDACFDHVEQGRMRVMERVKAEGEAEGRPPDGLTRTQSAGA
jgi:DNA-binding GntR family transcriptional regulator